MKHKIIFLWLSCILVVMHASCKKKIRSNEVLIGRIIEQASPVEKDSVAVASLISPLIHQQLIAADPYDSVFWPVLVKKIPELVKIKSGSVSTFTFDIRDSAKWDDGSSVTWRDILFSWKWNFINSKAWKDSAFSKNDFHFTADSNHLRKFSVTAAGVTVLSYCQWPVMEEKKFSWSGIFSRVAWNELILNPLPDSTRKKIATIDSLIVMSEQTIVSGSGAYEILNSDKQHFILQRKPNWFGNKYNSNNPYYTMYPAGVIYSFYHDKEKALDDLRSEKMDVLENIDGPTFNQLRQDDEVTCHYIFYACPDSSTYFAINRIHAEKTACRVAPYYWVGRFKSTFEPEP